MSTPVETMMTFPEARVHVRQVGDGPPLLLVNGLGAHTAMWQPLERVLADRFTLIEFDLPGAGRSPAPWRPVSVPRLAALTASLMDRLDVPRAPVLGYSMGGIVAQQLAADAPERVERLVLVATTPGRGAVQGELKALLNIMTPVRYLSPKAYQATIGSLVGGRARTDAEWVTGQTVLRLQHAPSWRGYLNQMASISRWSGMPIHRRITAPTLVVTGDDDPLTPVVNGMMLARMLPTSRLLVCPGEGHLLPLDERSTAHPVIRDFLCAPDAQESAAWEQSVDVTADDVRRELQRMSHRVPPWPTSGKRLRRRYLRRSDRAAQSVARA